MRPYIRALYDTRLEAIRLRHAQVHPLHLLLGLLKTENTAFIIVGQLLERKGENIASLRQDTEAILDTIKHVAMPPKLDDMRFSKEARRVSDEAKEIADDDELSVGCEHLLIALTYERGKIRRLLTKYGVTYEEVELELDMIFSFQ